MSCLGGGGSGRFLEIILCIRARHGIIRVRAHFVLPRDYHHPSGSGEQLCWVGGRGSAEGRPKLITQITRITGALPAAQEPAAAASPRAFTAAALFPGKGWCRDTRHPGRGLGAGMPLAQLFQGPPAPEPPAGAGEEPGIHWLRGAGSDWLRRGFAGKCHLLGEFGWPLAQPVPRQGRDAGTRPCQGRDAGTRPCHWRHAAPSVTFTGVRTGTGMALEFPGKWEKRDF